MSQTTPKKVALITGATPGSVGFALCKEWARRGYRVYGTVRRPALVEEIKSGGHGFDAIIMDVTDTASIQKAVAQIVKEAGRIDVLVRFSLRFRRATLFWRLIAALAGEQCRCTAIEPVGRNRSYSHQIGL